MKFQLFGYEVDINNKVFERFLPVPVKYNETTSQPNKVTDNNNVVPVSTRPTASKKPLNYREASRGEFLLPEWDFNLIGKMETVDSYVARSVKIKTSLGTKEGYEVVGRNKELVEYISKCYKYMSLVTKIPMELLVWRVFSDLILYSNAYLIKIRDSKKTIGLPYRVKGKEKIIEPVCGYIPVHPATMLISEDSKRVKKYKQLMPDGREIEWRPEDVVHFYYDKQPGFLTGKPTVIPVIEDVKLLRSLEENAALLVHRFLFPLYQYAIGTDKLPAGIDQDGNREVDVARATIEELPPEGVIVTGHTHNIKVIGAEGHALKAEGTIEYVKKRVLTGLALSGLDIGDGDTANRSTSDNLSDALVNHVKDFQQNLEWQWNSEINFELMLQYPKFKQIDLLSHDDSVFLRFNEIDKDSLIKMQNHAAQLWDQNGITWTELREALNREPLTEEEKEDTHFYQITLTELEAQVEAQVEADIIVGNKTKVSRIEKKNGAASTPTSTSSKKTVVPAKKTKTSSGSRGARSGAAKQTPSNQYGKKTSPEKRKSSLNTSGLIRMDKETRRYIYDKELLRKYVLDFIRDWFDNADSLCYNEDIISSLYTNLFNKMDHLITLDIKSESTIISFIDNFLSSSLSSYGDILWKKS